MYLPTFTKLHFERTLFTFARLAPAAIPIGAWAVWALYPSLYNVVFTDFFPPPRGVLRRVQEE